MMLRRRRFIRYSIFEDSTEKIIFLFYFQSNSALIAPIETNSLCSQRPAS